MLLLLYFALLNYKINTSSLRKAWKTPSKNGRNHKLPRTQNPKTNQALFIPEWILSVFSKKCFICVFLYGFTN